MLYLTLAPSSFAALANKCKPFIRHTEGRETVGREEAIIAMLARGDGVGVEPKPKTARILPLALKSFASFIKAHSNVVGSASCLSLKHAKT